jgi:hypothetical protein
MIIEIKEKGQDIRTNASFPFRTRSARIVSLVERSSISVSQNLYNLANFLLLLMKRRTRTTKEANDETPKLANLNTVQNKYNMIWDKTNGRPKLVAPILLPTQLVSFKLKTWSWWMAKNWQSKGRLGRGAPITNLGSVTITTDKRSKWFLVFLIKHCCFKLETIWDATSWLNTETNINTPLIDPNF